LGLSDASGQQLLGRLQRFGPALLEESGLVIKRQEASGFYDRFRARLMFPIHSESGKVIAFGGRALRPNDEPKYLNSPETRIYKKSSVLYNLHRAKIDARKHDRMILVEGYMDVIGIYSAGIHEVVASSGTSLGIEQVRAIKRQISDSVNRGNVFVTFDRDDAGARSTFKYVGPLLAEGLRVKVFDLPQGMDADEYVRDCGFETYNKQLEGIDRAIAFHYWVANHAKSKFDVNTLEGRVDAFRSLLPIFQNVSDRLERAAIIKEMAEYLKIDRAIVGQHLRETGSDSVKKSADCSSMVPPNEKLLLSCLLLSAEAREAIKDCVSRADILDLLELRRIFEAVLALDAEGIQFSVEALSSRLEPRAQRILTDLSFSELGIREEDAAQQAVHCLRALEAKAVDAARNRLRQRIRELEEQGEFSEALRLADELNRTKGAFSGV
jgi:DNA primase